MYFAVYLYCNLRLFQHLVNASPACRSSCRTPTVQFDFHPRMILSMQRDRSNSGSQRASFFQSLRKNLEEAATEGYSQFQKSCLLASQRIKEQFSDIPFLQDCSALQSVRRDKYSTRFLPKPLSHITPLQCYGDGNCLFRAGSILCCGSEVMHTELRVRTVCELVNNESYYLQPDIISIMDPWSGNEKVKQVLPAISANFNRACISTVDTDFAQEVYRIDCQETATDGTWCNMWHIHGLASVIRRPIMSIYPEVQDRIRPSLHRKVFPRMDEARNQPYCMIMWTRTCSMKGAGWEPNHFVPCFDATDRGCKQSSKGEPAVNSRGEKLNSSKSLRASDFYSKESKKVSIKPLETNVGISTESYTTNPVLIQNSFESPLSSLKPLNSRVPVDVLKSCTWMNNRQEQVPSQTVGSLNFADRTSKTDEISSVQSATKLQLSTGLQGVDPYEDFYETQSDLSSRYSSNKSSQSREHLQLPIVTAHLKTSHTQHASLPNDTITVTAEQVTPYTDINQSSSIPQHAVTCFAQAATLTTHISSLKYTVPGCDPHSYNSLQSVTSIQCGAPATSISCDSVQHHVIHDDSQSCLIDHTYGDHDSSPPCTSTTSSIDNVCTSPLNIISFTRTPAVCVSTLNKSVLKELDTQYSNHEHSSGSSVTAYVCEDGIDYGGHDRSVPLSSSPINSPSLATSCLFASSTPSYAGHSLENDNKQLPSQPASVTSPQSVKPATISPSAILMRYTKPKKKAAGNMSLMKWATIVPKSKSHENTAELATDNSISTTHEDSMLIESDDSIIMISLIHSPASFTSDNSDRGTHFDSMTPPEADMYDTYLQLSYSDNEDSMEVTQTPVNPLPFPKLSADWYRQQNAKYNKNASRERTRQCNPGQFDSDGKIQYVNRSRVDGYLMDNVRELEDSALTLAEGSSAKLHIRAVIAVGRFMISHGPIVKTQEVAKVYQQQKNVASKKDSIEVYEMLCKYFNISQVYIFDQAFIVQNSDGMNLECCLQSISSAIDEDFIVKKRLEDRLQGVFKSMLQYVDTHRDKQVLKALIAEVSDIAFAARLQGIQSRSGTRNAKQNVRNNLEKYQVIRTTSQIVRNDMTNRQQRQLTERIISTTKLKELRTIAPGRGRKLKYEKFPEMAAILEYAFGECDIKEGGGGLEAHPRLTNETMYRTSDNVTSMRKAREILLAFAPDGFHISLSACYNYTENYRSGSAQAKRHHEGGNVNAKVSLRKPPRTGVEQLIVNLHWSTTNVNLIVDGSQELSHSLIISKDAKAIVPADIAPVQHPGHLWKPRVEYPDHSWDQSRINAITPMTFLFMQTKVSQSPASTVECLNLQVSNNTTLYLNRTGQGVTLLNLSFYEPATTFRCMNEILYLLTLPELDAFFRDKATGNLKKEFIFIVDNGPAEQPSSSLVQLCLVRLLRLLKLHKVVQVSFAEYHSKRNFVERVHAEENRELSKHGPFCSKAIHEHASIGSKQHKENLEHMAEEVRRCISQGSFGSKHLMCFRGIKPADHVFTDMNQMQSFLALNEEAKSQFMPSTYKAEENHVLRDLNMFWNVDRVFEGSYMTDYKMVNNELCDGYQTCWSDKYTTVIYSQDEDIYCRRYELQPIPDYIRWFKTGELYYLPLEERALLLGEWDNNPGTYLPTAILDLCFAVMPNPPDDIINQIALLSWITPSEVKQYKKKITCQIDSQMEMDKEKDRWKSHPLYKQNTKEKLEAMCKKLQVPVTPAMAKHQLVEIVAEKTGIVPPKIDASLQYNGNLTALPTSTAGLNRLTIAKLRYILRHHGFAPIGSKDQLVLKVYLLRHGQITAIVAQERDRIKRLVSVCNQIILAQRSLHIKHHIYRRRKYTLQKKNPHFVSSPPHIQSEGDLIKLFDPLMAYIEKKQQQDITRLNSSTAVSKLFEHASKVPNSSESSNIDALMEQITQVGSVVKVKWTTEEVGDSGWKPGWYKATVQKFDEDSDTITLKYPRETIPYEEELTPLLSQGKIKLLQAVM